MISLFTIRPYRDQDASACGACLYEGFFTAPVSDSDRRFLGEYAKVLIEKCSFAYVAQTNDGQVVGFICGKYSKHLEQAHPSDTPKHYGQWCRMFLYYYLKRYRLSPAFQAQWNGFFLQLRERDEKLFGRCDLELVALASRTAYRKGLGTALTARFLARGRADGAGTVRLLTNSLASWEFYEKRGFDKVAEKPFRDGSGHRSIIYEYQLGGSADLPL